MDLPGEVPFDHCPQRSHPAETADILIEVIRAADTSERS